MKEEILKALENVEKEYDVTILYACESGSRAWGIESVDSDYDVRFIYKHKLDWYLTINDKKDVIDLPINDLLDIGGWDLLKSLKLIRSSNAHIFEWMNSPVVYKNKDYFLERIREISKDYYALKSACYHYLAQVRKGIKEHFTSDTIKLKKYFYILRPLLAARWIIEKREIPPMMFVPVQPDFPENHPVPEASLLPVLTDIISGTDNKIHDKIDKLLDIKKKATEKDVVKRLPLIDNFIEMEFNTFNDKMNELSGKNNNLEPLNNFFRSQVK